MHGKALLFLLLILLIALVASKKATSIVSKSPRAETNTNTSTSLICRQLCRRDLDCIARCCSHTAASSTATTQRKQEQHSKKNKKPNTQSGSPSSLSSSTLADTASAATSAAASTLITTAKQHKISVKTDLKEWGTGFCMDGYITNNEPTSQVTIESWSLSFAIKSNTNVKEFYECKLKRHTGQEYEIVPFQPYNTNIKGNGGHAQFTMCGNGPSLPTNILVKYKTTGDGSSKVFTIIHNGKNKGGSANNTTKPKPKKKPTAKPKVVTAKPKNGILPLAMPNAQGIIFKTSFETTTWMTLIPRGNNGSLGFSLSKGQYSDDSKVTTSQRVTGRQSLEYLNRKNEHGRSIYEFGLGEQPHSALYLRYYRKYSDKFKFTTEAKGNNLAARNGYERINAGSKPNGSDEFNCRVQVMPYGWTQGYNRNDNTHVHMGEPTLYCYHMNQPVYGNVSYGEKFIQNMGQDKKYIRAGEWHSYEFMIQPNAESSEDGQIKMWIDGELKLHKTNIQFRVTNKLMINVLEMGAYAGGERPAPQDQCVYDDNVVLSTRYIGPVKSGNDEIQDYPLAK